MRLLLGIEILRPQRDATALKIRRDECEIRKRRTNGDAYAVFHAHATATALANSSASAALVYIFQLPMMNFWRIVVSS